MKYILSIIFILSTVVGCREKMYNYKTVVNSDGTAYYYAYSIRKKGDVSKDVLSTGDTLCGTNKPPYQMFYISPITKDTIFVIK